MRRHSHSNVCVLEGMRESLRVWTAVLYRMPACVCTCMYIYLTAAAATAAAAAAAASTNSAASFLSFSFSFSAAVAAFPLLPTGAAGLASLPARRATGLHRDHRQNILLTLPVSQLHLPHTHRPRAHRCQYCLCSCRRPSCGPHRLLCSTPHCTAARAPPHAVEMCGHIRRIFCADFGVQCRLDIGMPAVSVARRHAFLPRYRPGSLPLAWGTNTPRQKHLRTVPSRATRCCSPALAPLLHSLLSLSPSRLIPFDAGSTRHTAWPKETNGQLLRPQCSPAHPGDATRQCQNARRSSLTARLASLPLRPSPRLNSPAKCRKSCSNVAFRETM